MRCFFLSELKHEILWKTFNITFNSLVKSSCFNSIQHRQIRIKHYLLASYYTYQRFYIDAVNAFDITNCDFKFCVGFFLCHILICFNASKMQTLSRKSR